MIKFIKSIFSRVPKQTKADVAYASAKKEAGTWEWGEGHNPKIVQWFADVGHSWVKDDETAWCAAFLGAMLEKAGIPSTRKLNARQHQTTVLHLTFTFLKKTGQLHRL